MGVEATFEKSEDTSLHPVKQLAIVAGGNRLGVVGELHAKVAEAFEITEPVCLLEINLATLLPLVAARKSYQPIPRFPAIVRDWALVVDAKLTHRQILEVIKGSLLITQVAIFDVYSGPQVPAGKKSLAYRITFQSPTHTLTDEEVDKVQKQILDRLSGEFGAVLRG